jgi:hypothetical protein
MSTKGLSKLELRRAFETPVLPNDWASHVSTPANASFVNFEIPSFDRPQGDRLPENEASRPRQGLRGADIRGTEHAP